MKVVLWDFICADLYAAESKAKDTTQNIDTLRIQLQESALKKNGTDRAAFNASFDWYENNAGEFKPLLDSMLAERSREMEKMRLQTFKIVKENEQGLR